METELGATKLSCAGATFVEGDGGPEGFYIGYGFRKTGKVIDGETEIVFDL